MGVSLCCYLRVSYYLIYLFKTTNKNCYPNDNNLTTEGLEFNYTMIFWISLDKIKKPEEHVVEKPILPFWFFISQKILKRIQQMLSTS